MMQMDFFNFGSDSGSNTTSVPKESRDSFILENSTLYPLEGDCQCPSELVV